MMFFEGSRGRGDAVFASADAAFDTASMRNKVAALRLALRPLGAADALVRPSYI